MLVFHEETKKLVKERRHLHAAYPQSYVPSGSRELPRSASTALIRMEAWRINHASVLTFVQSRGGTSPAGRSRYPSRATRQFRELVTPLPYISSTANRGTPSPTTASPAGSSQRSGNYVSCQLEPLRCNDARISPATASPEARGKLGAHSYERTTSALSARFESARQTGQRRVQLMRGAAAGRSLGRATTTRAGSSAQRSSLMRTGTRIDCGSRS